MDAVSLAAQFVAWSQSLAEAWGYLGIFLINILANATIFFPIPAFAVVFLFGAILNPLLVGIVSGLGAAIGEMVGYVLGIGGHKVLESKNRKWFERAKEWSEKRGIFPVIIVFAATPIPYDIIGILCGIIRYDIRKFFLATLVGKVIMNVVIALAGFYSVSWVLSVFGWA